MYILYDLIVNKNTFIDIILNIYKCRYLFD